jgi:ethanolamine utilization protein EutJ
MDLPETNNYLSDFIHVTDIDSVSSVDNNIELKVGIDLGTSSIVLVVLDNNNNPILGLAEEAKVVRDGLVVDFMEAVQIVKKLKNSAEQLLERDLNVASTAVPPGTFNKNREIFANVLESAEFDVLNIVDEPIAAAELLNINNGHIVDLGGGTTGVATISNNKIIQVFDEPTGGTHMSLVLAGYYNIGVDEAEKIKKDLNRSSEIFPIIRPVIEKMVSISIQAINKTNKLDLPVFLVGGASKIKGFKSVFDQNIVTEVYQSDHSEWITPIGIAMLMGAGD